MTAPNLFIAQHRPPGPTIGFGLSGDSSCTRSGGSGAGGWQLVDRPRRFATTEWLDSGPYELTISLIMDSYTHGVPTSLEPAIAVVESWEAPVVGSNPPLPPLVKVSGPVPHTELVWAVQSLTWKEAIRDPATGDRYQQNLDMVLWQYLPASIVIQQKSPAQIAQTGGSTGPTSATTYTVKAGDTLLTIATKLYGAYNWWTLLANANGIRDPNSVTPGEVLTVPAKTAQPPVLNVGPGVNQNNLNRINGQ